MKTINDGDEFSILLADGRKQTTRAKRTARIAVSIGEFTWRESIQVIPKISGYDLVLGKPWLSDINPEIIFKDNIMMLNDGTKKHNVVALDEDSGGTIQETKNTEPTSSQLSSVSIKEARKKLRKGAQLVIIQLSKDGEDLPTDSSWLTNVKIGVDGVKKEEITQLLEKQKKSDGSLRLVCDWRPLNKITTKMQACLPNIDDLFDTVTKQAHFVPGKGSINASGTADLYIENVFRPHGLSQSFESNRDPRFTSDLYNLRETWS